MIIQMYARTNYDTPYLNLMHVIDCDGKEVDIDRDTTEYTYNKSLNSMRVLWKNLYIWDGEDLYYDDLESVLKEAKLKELEIEDDAPSDYYFELVLCEFYDDEGHYHSLI